MSVIATVTLNPALDEAVEMESLVLGGKNRCSIDSLDPGGKGVNASRVMHRLAQPTIAYAFAGGLTGALLREKLSEERVPHEFVEVQEETRVNIMIYERSCRRRSRIYLPGPHIDAVQLQELYRRIAALPAGSVVVLGGSVPRGVAPTVYRDIIRTLNKNGVRSILDTSGEALAAAIQAAPSLVKPNMEEASELLGRPLGDDAGVLSAAYALRRLGVDQVVISQAERGAIGLNAAGAWKAVPPRITARSTAGSGESMVAGLAIAMDRDLPLPEGLRLGTACGAATAMTPGTRLCRAQDVHELLDRVTILPIKEGSARVAEPVG